MQNDFRVRVGDKAMTACLEKSAFALEIVNLPIVNDPNQLIGSGHWLVACRADIDDREPGHPKVDTRIGIDSVVIWAPMGQCSNHGLDSIPLVHPPKSTDSAHNLVLSWPSMKRQN